jgi:hypothetical protein
MECQVVSLLARNDERFGIPIVAKPFKLPLEWQHQDPESLQL